MMNAQVSITKKLNLYLLLLLFAVVALSFLAIGYVIRTDRGTVVSKWGHKLSESSSQWRDEIITRQLLGHVDAIELFESNAAKSEELDDIHFFNTIREFERHEMPCAINAAGYCYDSSRDKLYSVYYLSYGERNYGVLVKEKTIKASSMWKQYMVLFIVGMVMTFMLFIVFFGIVVNRQLIQPYNRVVEAMMPIGEGNFDIALPRPLNREMSLLVANIEKLVMNIKKYQLLSHQNAALATIGKMSAMVAHDIRKPFANMKALLDMLPARRQDDAFLKYAASQVGDSIRSAESMMSDMLEYSHQPKVEKSEVGIQSLVVSAVGDVFKNARDIDIVTHYAFAHRHCAYVDETELARAVTNIVDNAVGAMKGRGQIWIATREIEGEGGPRIELTIANNGPCIPSEDIEHLFDPFFTKGKKGGTGLGLAICHKIVTANGGTIDAHSSDERTEFVLTLPAGQGLEQIDESQLIHHSREITDIMPLEPTHRSLSEDIGIYQKLHKERGGQSALLIVDDEPLFRETIRALIQRIPEVRDSLKVVEAHSAEVALKLFEAREFDYVVSDIDMGRRNMDGYAFVGEVLDRYLRSLVMIHSNKRIHGKDEQLAERPHFQGFLPKPMDEEELMHFLSGKRFEPQPRCDAENPTARTAEMAIEALNSGCRVLIVNDEDFMRTTLRFQLRRLGDVQVLEADNVTDALRILREHGADVVLADINLGDIRYDGYDLLRGVKEQRSETKVYMMSGMQKEDAWPEARASGADGYIQIPYEEEELRRIVVSYV